MRQMRRPQPRPGGKRRGPRKIHLQELWPQAGDAVARPQCAATHGWSSRLSPVPRFTPRQRGARFLRIAIRQGFRRIKQDQSKPRRVDMAVTQAIPITRHPFADGSYKKMLIDGKWVDAASGKKFETHNPATGELLATVAEGDAEDINRAVAAARRAFEGPWSKVKPYERQAMLLRLADIVERNFEELSQLDTLDMGAPISRTRGNKLRVLGMLRYYAGQTTALHGETIENSLPGEIFSYTLKE